jgi:DUF4097 and DUF4098 domain-containing protein YvlB
MEMVVFAPSNLTLKIWASDGTVTLKNWGAAAELRSSSGNINGEELRGSRTSCLCQSCNVELKNARGSIRAMSETGSLELQNADATDVYLESAQNKVIIDDVRSDQLLLVTKSGSISAKNIRGNLEFHTQKGAVSVSDLIGFASGKSELGNIDVRALSWEFHDNAFIESRHGNVSVSLPGSFAGDIDVWSKKGDAEVAFPLKRSSEIPFNPKHWIGRIGEEATDLLKIYSETGNVKLLRRAR